MRILLAWLLVVACLVGLWGLFAFPFYLPDHDVPWTLAVPLWCAAGPLGFALHCAWVHLAETVGGTRA